VRPASDADRTVTWRDRDYSREGPELDQRAGLRAFARPGAAVAALLLVHVAAFALLAVVASEMSDPTGLAFLSLGGGQNHPLAILTHPLSTRNVGTLLLTGLVVWILGSAVVRQVGQSAVVVLYLVGNLLAGSVAFCLGLLWPAGARAPLESPLGATAAWAVVLWQSLPDQSLRWAGRLWRRWELLAGGAALVLLLTLALRGLGGIIHIAALLAGAGAVPVCDRLGRRAKARSRRSSMRRPPTRRPEPAEIDIDPILAKISRFGMNSLTPQERELLEAARRARLQAAGRTRKDT
jgi:membrane associated rhomboid family serine protease